MPERRTIACMLFAVALLGAASPAMARGSNCSGWDGAAVYSGKKFLGIFASKYDSKSVFNKYGTYGSPYSSDSIWNKYGKFGSPYASESAFNPYTSSAPVIVKNGKVIGRLSTNKHLSGAVNPLVLAMRCFDYEPN